jgi:hypothetical protein
MLRQSEATALLARTAADTCLVGLYCLHCLDPEEKMSGYGAKATGRLLAYLVDVEQDFLTKDVLDALIASAGQPKDFPRAKDMADAITKAQGQAFATDLYQRTYVPASTLFAHASALSLLRHVTMNDKLRPDPDFWWTRRAALRLVDSCTGVLAEELAQRDGRESKDFVDYANAHLARSLAPLIVMLVKMARNGLHWLKLPRVVLLVRAARKQELASAGLSLLRTEREARLRSLVDACLPVFAVEISDEARHLMADRLVEAVIGTNDRASEQEED